MGDDGISTTGDGAIIEGMRVESNGGIGIRVGDHSVVSGNTANNNGESGMLILGGVVSGNTASNNNNQGIALSGGLATGNTADNNEQYGLELLSYVSGYVNNVFFLNGSGPVSGGVNLKPNLCDGALCN
jgi:parallel beta-helix repeat protein